MSVDQPEKAPTPPAKPRLPFVAFVLFVGILAYWTATRTVGTWTVLFLALLPLAFGVAFIYLVMPISHRAKFWVEADPRVEPFDPDAPGTPAEVVAAIKALGPEMESLGFSHRGDFVFPTVTFNGSSYVTAFGNRPGRTSSWVYTTITVGPKSSKADTHIGFRTRFADGTEVITNNSGLLPIGPVRNDQQKFAFPQVDSPARLLALHRRALVEVGEFSLRIDPFETEPVEASAAIARAELAHLARSGYFWLEPGTGHYRLTWKGTFLAFWKNLPPLGPIRKRQRQIQSRRRLRDWESPLV